MSFHYANFVFTTRCFSGLVGILLSRETMDLRLSSVFGGIAAPAVAVQFNPGTADSVAFHAGEVYAWLCGC